MDKIVADIIAKTVDDVNLKLGQGFDLIELAISEKGENEIARAQLTLLMGVAIGIIEGVTEKSLEFGGENLALVSIKTFKDVIRINEKFAKGITQ